LDGGVFMLTMIHTEVLFVPPIHQPTVSQPSEWMMLQRATWPRIAACSGFLAAFGMNPMAFQNPEDNRFTPGPAPFTSHEHGTCRNGIHWLQSRRRRAMGRHKAERF